MILDKLLAEMKERFSCIIDPEAYNFEPLYMIATYLDPGMTVFISRHIPIVEKHLLNLVIFYKMKNYKCRSKTNFHHHLLWA